MKYIRTKDNIFEVESESDKRYLSDTKQIIVTMNGVQHMFCAIDKKDVIAKADAIDELCDRFVLIDDNEYSKEALFPLGRELIGERFSAMRDEFILRIREFGANPEKMHLYGAIFTKKGLIYIAETDEYLGLKLL